MLIDYLLRMLKVMIWAAGLGMTVHITVCLDMFANSSHSPLPKPNHPPAPKHTYRNSLPSSSHSLPPKPRNPSPTTSPLTQLQLAQRAIHSHLLNSYALALLCNGEQLDRAPPPSWGITFQRNRSARYVDTFTSLLLSFRELVSARGKA